MTRREYDRLTLEEAKKLTFRTTRPLQSGRIIIPAGTKVKVVGKMNGWAIWADHCPTCKVQVHMTRVGPSDLEVVDEA